MFFSDPAVHGVEGELGDALLTLSSPFQAIDDDDDGGGGYCTASAVSICFGWGLDDVGHIFIKLQLLALPACMLGNT